jgi:hypothetical protein
MGKKARAAQRKATQQNGGSKHRKARIQRFAAKNPDSPKVGKPK